MSENTIIEKNNWSENHAAIPGLTTATVKAERKVRWSKSMIGIILSLFCILFIVNKIDWHHLVIALLQFKWPFLFYGISSLACGYFFRILRWRIMLKATGANMTVSSCAAPFLGSIALNNIFPLRLGDVIRALVFPKAMGIDKTVATSSLLMERLIDLVTLFTALMFGLIITQQAELPRWLVHSVTALASLSGVFLMLCFLFSGRIALYLTRYSAANPSRYKKIITLIADFLTGFAAMSRFSILFTLFIISGLVWIGESGLFWCLLAGFQFDANFSLAILVMAIVTFSTLIPSSPGYVGPFHLAAFTAISILGGTSEQAASFAILCHLSIWVPTTLVGGLAIALTPGLFKSVFRNRKDESV